MRLAKHVKFVTGIKHSALYDDKTRRVYGLTDIEKDVIEAVSLGQRVNWSQLREFRNQQFKIVRWLRQNNLIQSARSQHKVDSSSPALEDKKSRFEHVWLELTNLCNLQCSHCYAGSGPNAKRIGELSLHEWKVIIDKLIRHGVKIITFIGGEPLTRVNELALLIEFARAQSKSLTIRVFSNLTHPKKLSKYLELFSKNNVAFGTSIYGTTQKHHDDMTNQAGSWKDTIASIKLLKNSDIYIFAGAYLKKPSDAEKENVELFMASLGIDDYEVLSPSNVGRGSAEDWVKVHLGSLRPRELYYPQGTFQDNKNFHNCFVDHLAIKPNGDVMPCIMQRNFNYGNILNESISLILNNSTYTEHSKLSKDKIEGCKDCEFRYGCFDCRPDAIGDTEQLHKKPDCGYDPYSDSYTFK